MSLSCSLNLLNLVWPSMGSYNPRLATDLLYAVTEVQAFRRFFKIRCHLECSKLYLDLENGNANILRQRVTFVVVGRFVTSSWESNILVYTGCPWRNGQIFGREFPYVKVYRYNPKHLYPNLNGYGENGQRILKI